jgi:hypothetical protein
MNRMSKPKTFVCDECGGTFPKDIDEAAVLAEAEKNFPGWDLNNAAIVCDDCYAKSTAYAVPDWADNLKPHGPQN